MQKDATGRYILPVGPEHVGANLLDIVSGALYSNVLDIIREYIQNSVDAGASGVRLVLRPKEIWIRDDGSGMTREGLDEARKIAVSGKKGPAVGFRGIGIYSSFAASQALEVITRPKGGAQVYSLRLDFRGMRKEADKRAAAQVPTPWPLQDAIEQFTEIRDFAGEVPMDDGASFTLIRIERPSAHLREVLEDEKELTPYLRRAVPLNFPPGHPIGGAVVKGLQAHGIKRRGIDIDLTPVGKDPGKQGDSRRIYMDDFQQLLRPSVREIHSSDGELLGVLWFAVHKQPVVIPGQRHGIQIRIKGFGIGDVTIAQREWAAAGSGVLYRHLVGELHIVHPSLRPSAERANIEDSPLRRRLTKSLKDEFKKINGWIQERQTHLARIVKHEETSKSDTNAVLDRLCAEYEADPSLKRSEILTDEAKKARKSGNASSSEEDPSDPGGGDGGSGEDSGSKGGDGSGGDSKSEGGGTGGDGGGGAGGGGKGSHTGKPPKLSKTLMDLNVEWKPKQKVGKVFTALDRAVQELDDPAQSVFLSAARNHLEKLVF